MKWDTGTELTPLASSQRLHEPEDQQTKKETVRAVEAEATLFPQWPLPDSQVTSQCWKDTLCEPCDCAKAPSPLVLEEQL